MSAVSMGQALAAGGDPPAVAAQFDHVLLPFQPMPHQWQGFYNSRTHHRSGLFFEPRTGKTLVLQMLAIFYARYGIGTIQIMPPGLFSQFLHDYHLIKHHGLQIALMGEGPAARAKQIRRWRDHPEQRPQVVMLSREIFKLEWADLYRLGFTNLHFDEAHLGLQNYSSQIARAVRAMASQHPENRLVLSTGTPIPNQIRNAYGMVNLLVPTAYRSQQAFDGTHVLFKSIFVPDARTGYTRTIKVVDSYVNLDLLSGAIYQRAIYASKREVLNLAAPNIQVIECELKPKHRKLYNKVLTERILEVNEEIIDARAAQKLRQVALQLISVPEAFADDFKPEDNSLYHTVAALLDSINLEKEKVVIFGNYISTIEHLERRFKPYHPAKVYGPNGPAKNGQEVERFHTQESCRLLIANSLAGGAGFKLGDVSTVVIFAEPVSTPGAFDQCLSRVMLKGQTEPVLCYIINVRNTISPLATEHMLNKVPDINKVMGSQKTLFDALLGKPVDYAAGPAHDPEERDEEGALAS